MVVVLSGFIIFVYALIRIYIYIHNVVPVMIIAMYRGAYYMYISIWRPFDYPYVLCLYITWMYVAMDIYVATMVTGNFAQ